jgi:hypothetical protein
MRAIFKAIVGASAFLALALTPAPAGAQEIEGVYIGPDASFGIYLDTDSRNHFRYRGAPPRRWDRYGHWYADPNRYRRFDRVRWTNRDCFPVSRWAYDRRGRDVRVVATRCYRRNGTTYVVPGSQRRIR